MFEVSNSNILGVFKDCVTVAPEKYLKGDWYDVYPASYIDICDNGNIDIVLWISPLDLYIKATIGKLYTTSGHKFTSIKKTEVFLCNESFIAKGILSGDPAFCVEVLDSKLKSILVKSLRVSYKEYDDVLLGRMKDPTLEMWDGDDLIGFRGD